MYCAKCGGEYREGFKVCADCGVELIERPEEAAPLPGTVQPDRELVLVFESGDVSDILLAKSLLDGAGIRYSARGDGLQDLFGLGRYGTGFSVIAGAAQFLVAEESAEAARELLAELAERDEADAT